MQGSLVEIVETQSTIIKMQSEVINSLFGQLMQHITAEEADLLPEVAKINQIASLLPNTYTGGE